jgi:nitroreductase
MTLVSIAQSGTTVTIGGITREIEGAAMGPVADRRSVELDELAWKFVGSEFSQDIYADWPLDRRLDAYLRHHQLGGIVNDGASLLDRVMTNIGAAHRGGILSHGADVRRRRLEPEMTQTEPGEDVIRNAVMLACRAPSLHNTQPWRWTFDGAGLHLFADRKRVVLSTDSTGREVLLSCGAVLDHLRVAMAAAGWDTTVERFPDPHDPDHVADLRFTPRSIVTDAQCERADAILARRTDRLPFDAPPEWPSMEVRLRLAAIPYHVMTDIVLDRDRPILAEASRLTEQLRSADPSYQSELNWWTSPFALTDGIPQTSLVSDSEAGRVDVARTFPSARPTERRPDIGVDRSKIILLSTTHEDARDDVLRCGEALSAVLLECTLAGLATCTLTHMTEVAPSRDIIRQLMGQTGSPQLLIRIGIAPSDQQQTPATPRRPLTEVLELRQ